MKPDLMTDSQALQTKSNMYIVHKTGYTAEYLLHNCGKIFFFILSFFIGYILSFGLVRLRTIRHSARVGTYIERRCSRSRGEDVTITHVIIKTPDKKWD